MSVEKYYANTLVFYIVCKMSNTYIYIYITSYFCIFFKLRIESDSLQSLCISWEKQTPTES